jgi:hypothetical protein
MRKNRTEDTFNNLISNCGNQMSRDAMNRLPDQLFRSRRATKDIFKEPLKRNAARCPNKMSLSDFEKKYSKESAILETALDLMDQYDITREEALDLATEYLYDY